MVLFFISILFCGYYRKRRLLQQQHGQNGVIVYSSGANTEQHIPSAYPQQPYTTTMPPSYQDAIKTAPPTYMTGIKRNTIMFFNLVFITAVDRLYI